MCIVLDAIEQAFFAQALEYELGDGAGELPFEEAEPGVDQVAAVLTERRDCRTGPCENG